jgi:sec-independent protein translocase protein TatB
MFDIAPSEFMLFALVALIVIGPKDLPKAMRVVGRFVGKARGMASQFRSGFDAMVREAELEEMEKKWKEENARIMAEHSALTDFSSSTPTFEPTSEPPALSAPAPTEEKPA